MLPTPTACPGEWQQTRARTAKCVRYGWNSGLRLDCLQLGHSPYRGRGGVGLLSVKEGPGFGQVGLEFCRALEQECQNCCPGSRESPQVREGTWNVIY